ncbi:IS3 family transposase [Limosilactobacillus balticus]
MGNFWGYYKDESYNGKIFTTFEEIVQSIHHYMNFYNNKRYQEK